MLPFLKRDKEGSAAMEVEIKVRKPDHEEEHDDMLHYVAEDMIHAMERKDSKLMAEALRAAFEIMESEEHFEGPHEED